MLIKNKRYLKQIFLIVTASISLTLIGFSILVFINATQVFQKTELENSNKILYQVKYNLDQQDATLRNLSTYLFFKPDIESIMYSREEINIADLSIMVNRLRNTIMSSNTYIDSIVIYNRNLDRTYYVGKSVYFEDTSLIQLIRSGAIPPLLKPVPRIIENESSRSQDYDRVFSYFMYDSINSNRMNGAVIININYEWFQNNLYNINMIDKEKGENIFLMNNKMEFIDVNKVEEPFQTSLRDYYLKYATGETEGYFEEVIAGIKYFVTYIHMDNINFTLLKVQQSAYIYKNLNSLKTAVLIITLIFLAFTLMLSITVSRKIYWPVSNLIKQVGIKSNHEGEALLKIDEIAYLDSAYQENMNTIEKYQIEQKQQKNKLKEYELKRLILAHYELRNSQPHALTEYPSLASLLSHFHIVCVLKIDYFKSFMQHYGKDQRSLIGFAICNIVAEIVSKKYPAEGVDMYDDHVALVIGSGKDQQFQQEEIELLLQRAQNYIKAKYQLSITVSISDPANHFSELAMGYSHALNQSEYRFIFGRGSVITPGKVAPHIENERQSYSKRLEKQLLDAIKSGDQQQVHNMLRMLLEEISAFSHNFSIIALLRLTDTINRTVDQMMKSTLEPISFNFSAISREILNVETIEDFYDLIILSLQDVWSKDKNDEVLLRNKLIVESIMTIIDQNYHRASLNQDEIASQLRISSRRLSKIVKDETGVSISEHINETRMNKAAVWLEKSDLSVHEIISKVGIENETYFYTIFKKKFGMTPREYGMQQSLNARQTRVVIKGNKLTE